MIVDEVMEMLHQGAEAETLLRRDRGALIMPQSARASGWESSDGEKAPFLRHEPVKLTPAWEGTNLPNDTLNLKGIAMDLAPPRDKWHLIYLTLMLHGLGTLTAWNMFITAKNYFSNYKLVGAPYYSTNFLMLIGVAAQTPNFLFSWFNVFVTLSGNLTTRIVWSLCIEVVIFVITIVLAMIDSSQWPVAFFYVTAVTVFFMNGFNSIFQNSVYGVAAKLPPKYTGAVVLGSNISGTLVAFLDWMSDYFGGSLRTAAIYYFIGGMLVLLICFDTYFALPLNRYYRYYDTLVERTKTQPQPGAPASTSTPYGRILRQCWPQLYNVFVVFFVSLAVFPAVCADVKPNQPGFLGGDFMRITCFITFNLTALIGNITASLWHFPSRKWLFVFTTIRFLFIPFFLLCNYKTGVGEGRTLPVLIKNDWVYWCFVGLLGWSSGHGSSLGMMYVTGKVDTEYAPKAGMIGAATLCTGIIAGILFTYVCPILVSLQIWQQM